MTGAPSAVPDVQLAEVHVSVRPKPDKAATDKSAPGQGAEAKPA